MLLILNFIAFIISIETEASLLALAKSIIILLHDSAQNALMESVTPIQHCNSTYPAWTTS